VAQTLNYQGDNAYFAADLKGARALYEQAQTAGRLADRYQLLRARMNLAKIGAEEGRPAAAAELRTLTKESEDLGLKYLAAETSLHLGAALLKANNLAQAKAALESGMVRSERIGARALQASGAYLLGEAVRRSGTAVNAAPHYRQALQVLDELQKEARTDSLATRFDLRQVREQSTRWLDTIKK
jgi:tetratricopeptide (TPR) repeat protein